MRLMKWCVAGAVVLGASAPASAFFWPDWPSTPVAKIDQTVLPPGTATPGTPVANPTFPGGDIDYPTVPPKPPLPPSDVPEPATGVAGLIGLGVLAARKWRKRK